MSDYLFIYVTEISKLVKAQYKSTLKTLLICVIIFCISVITGLIMLLFAYRIVPNENTAVSRTTLENEGSYPSALGQYNNLFYHQFDDNSATLDGGTDARILDTASEAPAQDTFRQMLSNLDYPRYWHGYLLPLKLILHFMDLEEWRSLNFFLQLSLVIFTCFVIYCKTKKARFIPALLTSYFLLMPVAVSESLQYTPVFYITFTGILIIAAFDRIKEGSSAIYLFLLLGIATSYFDLLTFPLLTWALPALWLTALSSYDKASKSFLSVAKTAVSWLSGYALFWLAKWVIATPVLGYNVVKEAFSEIFVRTGTIEEEIEHFFFAFNRTDNIFLNWKHYENHAYTLIILAWIVVSIVISLDGRFSLRRFDPAYPIIGFSGIAWYLVLSNHTTIHHFMTYRIFNICISAFALFLCSYEFDKSAKKNSLKKAVINASVWLVILIISIPISGIAKEKNVREDVGDAHEVSLSDGDVLTFDYTPYLGNIKEMTFCFFNPVGDGRVDVSISDEGNEVYSYVMDLSENATSTFVVKYHDLHLDEGRSYTITLKLSGTDTAITYISDTPSDQNSCDIGNVNLNGTDIGLDIIHSITYRGRVKDLARRLMLSLEIMGLIGTVLFTFLQLNTRRK